MKFYSVPTVLFILFSAFCKQPHAAENSESSENSSNHTFSVGYAVTDVSGSMKNKYRSTNLGGFQDILESFNWQDGFNLKYRYDSSNKWSSVVSYTRTSIDSSGKRSSREMRYSDFMIGPGYRLNDYFSTYVLIGLSEGEYDLKIKNSAESAKKYGISSGIGVQINPTKALVFDIGYEFSHLKYKEVSGDYNSFVIGAGYRF